MLNHILDSDQITSGIMTMIENDLVYRLRKRAEIRRQIPTRKSVQEGLPDRIADLLEEAADEISRLHNVILELETDLNIERYGE